MCKANISFYQIPKNKHVVQSQTGNDFLLADCYAFFHITTSDKSNMTLIGLKKKPENVNVCLEVKALFKNCNIKLFSWKKPHAFVKKL